MTVFNRFCRALAMPLALVILFVSLPANLAQAAMVSTDQVLAESETESDRARVLAFLAREDVRQQITALGVDPDEATRRVQGLSDVEIAKIVDQMDQEPAGQGIVVILVATILIIFLIFIITDLVGATDIFPFINPI
ncbi:MAG: PA2779 family protein [Kiloniellales bacterium]|nr:PA2779 family protein [Kiloniellales bacterium]